MLNEIQLAELKSEIEDDTKGLGYSGKGDEDIATLLNTHGLVNPEEKIARTVIDGQELSAVVVTGEYKLLPAIERDLWMTILAAGSGQVDVSNGGIRTQIGDIWGLGTDTRDNLVALQERVCSRAETLFGAGVIVTYLEVGKTRW